MPEGPLLLDAACLGAIGLSAMPSLRAGGGDELGGDAAGLAAFVDAGGRPGSELAC